MPPGVAIALRRAPPSLAMRLILDAADRAGINRTDGPRDRQRPRRDAATPPARPARRWLRRDEGWAPSEDLARLAAAIGIALGAVALKVLIVGVLGGELGYLSYLGRRRPRGLDRRRPRRRHRDDHLRDRPDAPVLASGHPGPDALRGVQPRPVPGRRDDRHDPVLAPAARVRARARRADHRRGRPRAPVRAAPGGRARPLGARHAADGHREPVGCPDARRGRRRHPRSRAGRPRRGGRRRQPRPGRRGGGRGARGPRLSRRGAGDAGRAPAPVPPAPRPSTRAGRCSCPTSPRGRRATRTARRGRWPGAGEDGAIAVLPMVAGTRTLGAIVFRFSRRPRLRGRDRRPRRPPGRAGRAGARPCAGLGPATGGRGRRSSAVRDGSRSSSVRATSSASSSTSPRPSAACRR